MRILFVTSSFAALCIVLLSACSTPYGKPQLEPPDAEFPSLSQLINEMPKEGALDVLSVHGMCSHDREWVTSTGHRFSESLGLGYAEPDEPIRTVDEVEIWLNELSDGTGKVVLRDYALVWSRLTDGLKQTLCYDASLPTPSCPERRFEGKRARMNSELKSVLLNDCLSDAIIYLGPEGDRIRKAIRSAIIEVGHERGDKANTLVLMTESLGSKIVVDAVIGPDRSQRRQALAALQGTKIIFMAANQIPMLNLAYGSDVRAEGDRPTIDDLRRAVEQFGPDEERRDRAAPIEDVYIVAFSDPNDLLSYELAIPSDRTTVNVRVSNAPTIVGFIENPSAAHTSYLDNEEVWRLINCGRTRSCD